MTFNTYIVLAWKVLHYDVANTTNALIYARNVKYL